jgi:ubiquinone/menaquinone biosynthesis C-methylase UbiE
MLEKNLNPIETLQKIGVKRGMTIGDFGCGQRGTFTFAAAEIVGKTGKVYAIDVLKPVLKSINDQARLEGFEQIIKIVWSNLEKYQATDIENESLDIGIIINVLFQTDYPAKIIKEAARMIKKDGRLLISDWLTSSYLGKIANKKHTNIDKKKLKTTKEIKTIAAKLGLKLVEEFRPWDSNFGLVFEK